jgi:hypothetical protein
MNPHSYAYLTFHKCTKNIQWRNAASSTNVVGNIRYLHVESWN